MEKNLREEVRRFLLQYFDDLNAVKIDEADLFGCGRIEGDDADEFLEAFMDRFSVDMSGFEPWLHYDADEPPSVTGRRTVPVDADGKVVPLQPISLEDLVRAAETGNWSSDYPPLGFRKSSPSRFRSGLLSVFLVAVIVLGFWEAGVFDRNH